MRHFPPPGPVATLASSVVHATRAAALIPRPGRATRRPPRRLGATRAAVTLAAVAVATDRHLAATTGAVEQAGSRGHRQLLPMSPGSSSTSGRYLPTARATHGPGYGTGEDCGGCDQCRTCLNGTDHLAHRATRVTARARCRRGGCASPGGYQEQVRRVRPRLRYAPPGTDPAQSRSQAAAAPCSRPFPMTPNPPSPSERPVFTTLVGDCPRYPPTIGRFG
jgi:hypothetical protein